MIPSTISITASARDRPASASDQSGGEWDGYVLAGYPFYDFPPGSVVLDLGCGEGGQLLELQRRGRIPIGLDLDPGCLRRCERGGLRVIRARAEGIALKARCLDGLVCKVVLPYTDEARALGEIGRVLAVGAKAILCYHGAGYYVRYLVCGRSWKHRVYALRALVNTWVYLLTKMRLPGFLGDTIYQSRQRLNRYYRNGRLVLVEDAPARRFLGFPVFIYHRLQKAPES